MPGYIEQRTMPLLHQHLRRHLGAVEIGGRDAIEAHLGVRAVHQDGWDPSFQQELCQLRRWIDAHEEDRLGTLCHHIVDDALDVFCAISGKAHLDGHRRGAGFRDHPLDDTVVKPGQAIGRPVEGHIGVDMAGHAAFGSPRLIAHIAREPTNALAQILADPRSVREGSGYRADRNTKRLGEIILVFSLGHISLHFANLRATLRKYVRVAIFPERPKGSPRVFFGAIPGPGTKIRDRRMRSH
ncbi:hypothetical protein CHELA1G11_22040 [Hyphomicrobiales bacterium]|nr:hypothetical protein CHELA1G2_20305 [Hyphomicrobiales bacterium]CAH1695830.1 hypothetical protein CHELA1G11_22040 [Hyphomicrobiales bacterium]